MGKKQNDRHLASIHTSFNMFRAPHDAHTGPVTLDEHIKAVERMVRWHQRQVEVAQQLLGKLHMQKVAEEQAQTTVAADPSLPPQVG